VRRCVLIDQGRRRCRRHHDHRGLGQGRARSRGARGLDRGAVANADTASLVQIMTAWPLGRSARAERQDIDKRMGGNIVPCGQYRGICRAIKAPQVQKDLTMAKAPKIARRTCSLMSRDRGRMAVALLIFYLSPAVSEPLNVHPHWRSGCSTICSKWMSDGQDHGDRAARRKWDQGVDHDACHSVARKWTLESLASP